MGYEQVIWAEHVDSVPMRSEHRGLLYEVRRWPASTQEEPRRQWPLVLAECSCILRDAPDCSIV
jgi:hypothetical protein